MKYLIAGPLQVADKNPGSILDESDLAGCNIPALIEAGHLSPIKVKPSKEESE